MRKEPFARGMPHERGGHRAREMPQESGGQPERGGRHRGERGEHRDPRTIPGAQTFRRGRVLAFLEQLKVRRTTIARQLSEPEFEPIRQVLAGELKALDQVIEDYVHSFELDENGPGPGTGSESADEEGRNG